VVDGDGLENRCAKAPGVRIPLSPPLSLLGKTGRVLRPGRSGKSDMVLFGLEKYPRGRRGSPAKGVVRDERSKGSNPFFSANPLVTVFTAVTNAFYGLEVSLDNPRNCI